MAITFKKATFAYDKKPCSNMEAILQKVHTASWRRFLKETNKV